MQRGKRSQRKQVSNRKNSACLGKMPWSCGLPCFEQAVPRTAQYWHIMGLLLSQYIFICQKPSLTFVTSQLAYEELFNSHLQYSPKMCWSSVVPLKTEGSDPQHHSGFFFWVKKSWVISEGRCLKLFLLWIWISSKEFYFATLPMLKIL